MKLSATIPQTHQIWHRTDFQSIINLFLAILLCALSTLVKTKVLCHIKKGMPARSEMLFSPSAEMYQFFTSACHERDWCSCEASQRSDSHVPPLHPNLGRYISKFNSPLPCCMSCSCAAVCVASSKSQEVVITSAVVHMCQREKEAARAEINLVWHIWNTSSHP